MVCKGICYKHKAKKPFMKSRYAEGQKRCSICEIFVKWEGVDCPCCGMNLRTSPRNTQNRQNLLLFKQKH